MMPPNNWETDPRSFTAVLAAWIASHNWSDAEAARQLPVAYLTLRAWLGKDGRHRKPRLEILIRHRMAEIDSAKLSG